MRLSDPGSFRTTALRSRHITPRSLVLAGVGSAGLALVVASAIRPAVVADAGAGQPIVEEVRSLLADDAATSALDVRFAETLREFYADSSVTALWVDGDRELSDRATALLEAIDDSRTHGLEPTRYRTAALDSTLSVLSDAGIEASARAEVLVTDAFLRLADALARGSQDPGDAGLEWGIQRDRLSHADLLDHVAEGRSPPDALERLRPRLPWYDPMLEALAEYREAEQDGGWPQVPSEATLTLGDSAAAVAAVRARLTRGMDPRARELAAEGSSSPDVFDAALAEAVALFQERHGIAVDSVFGPSTASEMNVAAAERVDALELNLDRLRRLPRDLGERAILVNVAGFELAVLEDQEPVMEMDVVVGRPEWRTRIFQDRMEYLVVNPYWHVPESIEKEEILPRLRADSTDLVDEGLVLVHEEDNFGPAVSPVGIDWASVDTASFPYDFRQEPGPSNALGLIKFMFPNDYNIYLHDTPADALFRKDIRAFSHGCIRVEQPRRLARYILEHASDTPPERLDELIREGEWTRLDLTNPIPVYVTYFTAWVEPNGPVHFYPDVYERDEALSRAGTGDHE